MTVKKLPTNAAVVKRWREEVCERSGDIDPDNELTWEGIWFGFVIGLGRPDLATNYNYLKLGLPEEGE